MAELHARDLRGALDVVHALHEDDAEDTGLVLLGRLVGCDQVSVIDSDHVSRRLAAVTLTHPDRDLTGRPGFADAVSGHPGFAAYRSGRLAVGESVALTDLVTPRELRRLPLYADFYRPQGTADQLLGIIRLTGRIGLTAVLNRSRPGFTGRDRAVLDLLVPHLGQARRQRARLAALGAATRTGALLDAQHLRSPTALADLTAREREVAHWIAEGATDAEVARGLGISVRTVHKHVERVFRKLGLTNRAGLGAVVHRASG
ncbi:helix-turn-helix transcriptional regulator [Saccharothrix sp. Mg75]|uniref:helix-turn-helix transcriptional regulator n=1 Tax=Saccharothrix sp. Mg75 TaxID=3445357 RepID=UPI003EF04765